MGGGTKVGTGAAATAAAATATKKRREISPLTKNYLIGYNLMQTVGWSYLLYQVVRHQLFDARPVGEKPSLYDEIAWTLTVFQNAAALEVVHVAIGIVPSNLVITFQQVLSRVFVTTGVLWLSLAARASIGLPMIMCAWGVTEVIRYSNYTLALLGAVPYFITYLRYTTFIFLYPLGVTGELLCIYQAANEFLAADRLSIWMPNQFNVIFSYGYLCYFGISLYLPLFPGMYLHMFRQRRKVLGGAADSNATRKVK